MSCMEGNKERNLLTKGLRVWWVSVVSVIKILNRSQLTRKG